MPSAIFTTSIWDRTSGPIWKKIDATLAPFHGRFIIHGGEKEMLEGAFRGDLIVIGFPDRASARAWYFSPIGFQRRAYSACASWSEISVPTMSQYPFTPTALPDDCKPTP